MNKRKHTLKGQAASISTPTHFPNEINSSGIFEAALEISEQRREQLSELKSALLSGDDKRALQLARQYCGIADSAVSDGTD